MRLIEFLIILCLSLLAGRDLFAQGNQSSQQKFAHGYYSLSDLKMSDDGKWLTIRKFYDLNRDTVLIFSSKNTEQPVGYKTKVQSIAFLSNDNLLMQSPLQTELLNPEKMTGKCFKDVKRSQSLNNNRQFLLHYDDEEKNRLELRDCCGKLLNALNNVNKYYATKSNKIYAITENGKNGYDVYCLLDENQNKIYSSGQKIVSLETDPGEMGIMVYEQNPDSNTQELLYLDLTTRECFPQKEPLPLSFKKGSCEAIGEKDICFLNLQLQSEKEDTSMVDIWYGNDNKLEDKFLQKKRNLYYVWEPKNKKIWRIGNDSLTTCINIGSDRYFLCFDPYGLQDYTTVRTPLQVAIYDNFQDEYSFLDTITDDLYLTGNGEYALSKRKSKWCLYHIPSGRKKLIQEEGLGNPWFNNDGEYVLFEGEGALWKYDLENGQLDEAVTFRGFQTSIVNGESEEISTPKGQFRRHHLCFTKPVMIKLFNQDQNITSYVLWNKGKTEIVVPPSTRRIQFLIYNKSYYYFSWIEEDYNLTPRVVFKKRGEKEFILYQSNKADKVILSLRQEIISYIDNEGSLLKGILFYPLNYDSSQQYPMVVHIYEMQRTLSNKFPNLSYYEDAGFNIRLMLEKGYFVYLPDILIHGNDGPGLDAIDCVNKALDALAGNTAIDQQRIGLIGFSFGGYETDFIATHSKRFAAYVSGAGHSDIIWAYHAFNYNFLFPDYVRIEAHQYKMVVSFADNKLLYFENNPLFYSKNVHAPVLLWSGLEDENITSDHTMAFYNALRRNKKDVVALFYKGEGHGLQKPQAKYDLTSKILEWFDYFLKDKADAEWIRAGVK